MDIKDIIGKVISGEASVSQLGSARVAEDADRAGVAVAMETTMVAQQFASMGEQLRRSGDLRGAIQCYCNSICLEESINNIWGICSDVGNIAEIYRAIKAYDEAEDIFVWLREKDQELIRRPTHAPGFKETEVPEAQLQDYYLLLGMHTEGLARVYIATGRQSSALALMDEIIESYQKASPGPHLERAHDLLAWLKRHQGDSAKST